MFFLAATSIIKQVFLFPLWIDLGKILYIHINILFSKLSLYVCSFVCLLRFHSYNATLNFIQIWHGDSYFDFWGRTRARDSQHTRG